jgi:hypothetical protein
VVQALSAATASRDAESARQLRSVVESTLVYLEDDMSQVPTAALVSLRVRALFLC